jgi:bifunctional UDP-N-acetylglucosamine pyrophosphorylase/glucosamine-1-phosphate N-acetyltransferase
VNTVLVVPAAGLGSRLGSTLPKLLHPVAGAPMIDHLAALYRAHVTRWVFVCRPADDAAVRAACERLGLAADVVHQPSATGMLDALLIPVSLVAACAPDFVWLTWADQIAIHPLTVLRLASTARVSPRPALVMPTSLRPAPYIHFDRDAARRIVAVRQRREGDVMPEMGEADCGLFSLTRPAYVDLLPAYAGEAAARGASTGERNFLPFVAWLQARARIETFPSMEPIESVGVNTPEDQADVERGLAKRPADPTA